MDKGAQFDLRADRVVAGGVCIGRHEDGRIVFVDGALPGEQVTVRVDRSHKDRLHASAVQVIEASPFRVEAPCPRVAAGCGGCQWQHVGTAYQAILKRDIVVDALRRIAHHHDESVVRDAVVLRDRDYRTTVRAAALADGRLAYRRRASHDLEAIAGCLVAHPLARDVIDAAEAVGGGELTIRVGAATSDTIVVVDPAKMQVHGLDPSVRVVSPLDGAHYHERVRDKTLRISATSFFQSHVDAPEVLVELVTDALAPLGSLRRVADLYCGVGLFGAFVEADSIIAVESNRAAARDAKHNLRGRKAVVVCADVAHADLGDCDAVIADPSREGLGRRGVEVVIAADPDTIVLISCDPAAGARDILALQAAGYRLVSVQPVDQFPHTTHVEMVSVLRR